MAPPASAEEAGPSRAPASPQSAAQSAAQRVAQRVAEAARRLQGGGPEARRGLAPEAVSAAIAHFLGVEGTPHLSDKSDFVMEVVAGIALQKAQKAQEAQEAQEADGTAPPPAAPGGGRPRVAGKRKAGAALPGAALPGAAVLDASDVVVLEDSGKVVSRTPGERLPNKDVLIFLLQITHKGPGSDEGELKGLVCIDGELLILPHLQTLASLWDGNCPGAQVYLLVSNVDSEEARWMSLYDVAKALGCDATLPQQTKRIWSTLARWLATKKHYYAAAVGGRDKKASPLAGRVTMPPCIVDATSAALGTFDDSKADLEGGLQVMFARKAEAEAFIKGHRNEAADGEADGEADGAV